MDQQKVFCDVFEKKEASLDYKNTASKNPSNMHFSKSVSPWFL